MNAPDDDVLVDTIAKATGDEVVLLGRRPYEYATSAALEEVTVRIGVHEQALILKHLGWDGLIGDARTSKHARLHEPRRELGAYRTLAADGVTPHFYGGADGADAWMLVGKVNGVELWQIGDVAVWRAVAAWTARFHDRYIDHLDELRTKNPHLVMYDGDWVSSWMDRGVTAVAAADHPRKSELADVLAHRAAIVAEWESLPVRYVHGELYPSNVLVGPGPTPDIEHLDIRPIDWEMTGLGPAALDLAALTGGWDRVERDSLIAAYADASTSDVRDLRRAVDLATLHLALRWLGWADGWNPPAQHANDWVNEALSARADLGFG